MVASLSPTTPTNPYIDLAQIKTDYKLGLITARGAVMFAIRMLNRGGPIHIGNLSKFSKRLGPTARVVRLAISKLKVEGLIDWKEHNGLDLWAIASPPPPQQKVAQRRIVPKSGSIDPNADHLIPPDADRSIRGGIDRSYQKRSKRRLKKRFKLCSKNIYILSPSFKKREREKGEKQVFQIESEPVEQAESQGSGVTVASPQEAPSTPPTPPPSPPAAFDWRVYNWASYSEPGSGGSDPDFWHYTIQKVTQFARERREQQHPNQIGDIPAYALGMIRRQGRDRYEAFLVARGIMPPPPPRQAAALPASTPAKPPDPREQWHQAHQTLNRLWESGSHDQVFQNLQFYLQTRPGMPADPDKVRWLLQQSPHWGFQFVDGRLLKPAPVDDLSEVMAQISVHLRRLQWSADQTKQHLQQTYGKTRAMLEDAELCDFLFHLEAQPGGGP